MYTQAFALAALAISGSYASPVMKRDQCSTACLNAYDTCRGQPNANFATCASQYASCLGYSPFDNSGSLVTPTACSGSVAPATATPVICNAAAIARGDCTATAASVPTTLPLICNAAAIARGDCTATAASVPTALPFICNAAAIARGDCTATAANVPTTVTAAAAAPVAATSTAAPVIAGAQWTVKDLSRYCSEDGSGCDYNFKINYNDGRAEEACTVVRNNVPQALTESWFDQPCTTGSSTKISWGYSTQFSTPFAVLTVVDTAHKERAFFGVSNPNGKPVTVSNPAGSGSFGDIGPQPVQGY